MIVIKYQSGGKRRYCNGVCHKAKGHTCACICGGKYHGAGRDSTLNSKIVQHQKELLAELSVSGEVLQAIIPLL